MLVAARSLALCACLALLGGCQFSGVDLSPVAKDRGETAYFATGLATSPQGAAVEQSRDIRAPDGLFYADALVNGVRVRFVVDSGSSLVVFSRKDAERAGVNRAPRHGLQVHTASGIAQMEGVTIRHLNIDGRALDHVEAVIADDISGASLLGQSALSRLDAVTFSGDRLQLH